MEDQEEFICEIEYVVRERVNVLANNSDHARTVAEDNCQGILEERRIISPRLVKFAQARKSLSMD